jgi:hypothetical protein
MNLAALSYHMFGEERMSGETLHLLCRHQDVEPDTGAARLKEIELLAGQYRLGVETQMHFNQLIIRTRIMGTYGVILVMGGALLLRSQYPTAAGFRWDIPQLTLPPGLFGPYTLTLSTAALIALFGPILLAVVYLMDRSYYLNLLGGASRYVYHLEDQATKLGISLAGVNAAFGQGRTIQHAFGPRLGASTKYVKRAYRLVGLCEIVVIILLVLNP